MAQRQRERLKKHTIRLRAGDVADLDAAYPTIGHNRVVRQLVSDFVDRLRREAAIPTLEIAEELPE